MISTRVVLSALKEQMDLASINAFLDVAPQSVAYPFVTFQVISDPVEYTFATIMDNPRIQISLFSSSGDITDIMDFADTVETALDDFSKSTIYCTHRDNERGPYFNDKDHYWQIDMDYIFKVSRDKA